ncbi:MAG: helix-turn-helix transcriptional regulator [Firmicutes bacterium]|jgi:DNA-binding Xre family transcriptional regulator|nr:helix-turn-helix transcriptional regulator [Bacillota bacterium]
MATLHINTYRLGAIMTERHWTERDVAREMDIATSNLNRILNENRGSGVHAIAHGLG